jgi:hypothetical protein
VVRLLRYSCPLHAACSGFKGGRAICVKSIHNWRYFLGTATLTMGCCRPDDGSGCDSCDSWPTHDADTGYVHFEGGGALNVKKMEYDPMIRVAWSVPSGMGAQPIQSLM